MYLGSSKYWWAYLGIKSNPSIVSPMAERFNRAIFFDDPLHLPPEHANFGRSNYRYFYIFWDGLSHEKAIEEGMFLLGRKADLTVLVVGDIARIPGEKYKIQSLYPEGELSFGASPLHFGFRTAAILLGARIKTVSMPLKNLLQGKERILQSIKLLCGKKQVVFCGTYGTTPAVIEMLCDRHSVDFGLFERYEFYCNDPRPCLETYKNYLRSDGLFLADLYERSEIDATFFLSMVHLLGREYFIERIRSTGLDMFVNGYAAGSNVNVYTTPFYSQHIFIDFGSVVGTGNYPRLVDLRYFKKKTVEIGMTGKIEELLSLARIGTIEKHFEREWELKSPQIRRLMASSR